MKPAFRIAADTIVIIHSLLVILVLFGWAFPGLWAIYISGLTATLLSDLIFGYCILTKWEFNLRKKIKPDLNYDFSWASYYTYKFTNHRISNNFYRVASIIFLALSIGVSLYFKFIF